MCISDAAHGGGLRSYIGQNRYLGGGRGGASVVGRGGGKEDRAVGDEGRGESVQLHAVVLRRGREQVGCSDGYIGSVV